MLLTVFSGIMSQILRVADLAGAAFFTYYLHLIFVFYLLAYAPQTKFGHIFYRPVALIYARFSGRTRELGWDEKTKTEEMAA
jgi:quinone-modifying oxidoreductase subunit QmoC